MGNIAGKTKCCGNAGNAIPKLNASPYEYHDRLKELK